MRAAMLVLAVFALMLLAPACPQQPSPPPEPPVIVVSVDSGGLDGYVVNPGPQDAGPKDDCFFGCQNAWILGCVSDVPRCADVCRRGASIVDFAVTPTTQFPHPGGCLAAAKTKMDLRNCGSMRCP